MVLGLALDSAGASNAQAMRAHTQSLDLELVDVKAALAHASEQV